MSAEKGPGSEDSSASPELHEAEGRITYTAESVTSENHPERNEDSYFALPEHRSFGVFDGMSIPSGGELASQLAADTVNKKMMELPNNATVKEVSQHLQQAFTEADKTIADYGLQHQEYQGIATTASAVKIIHEAQGGKFAVISNAGDSRIYLFREGKLSCLTIDDSLPISTAGNAGSRKLQKRLSEVIDRQTMTEKELAQFRTQNVITNSLGQGYTPRIAMEEVFSGDKLIITSDGIHDNLTDTEIEKIMTLTDSPQAAVPLLLKAAVARSHEQGHLRAKKDDMTALVINI